MADGFTISLEGEKELIRKFETLEPKVARKVVRQAVRKGGKTLLQATKAKVPVDTGKLKKFIKLRSEKNKRKSGRIGVRVWPPLREDLDIDPSDRHYYPAVVEFGSQTVPARSYLRAALNENAAKILNQMTTDIGKGIESEFGKP